MGYTKFQHSRKAGRPSDSDKQELCELETRERNIIDKIADAKRQLEMEEVFDDTISVGYVCNKCSKTIEGVRVRACVRACVCVCVCLVYRSCLGDLVVFPACT